MSLLLADEEIAELTGRARHDDQVRVLRAMGIEHRVRPDGSIAVARSHYEQIFGIQQAFITRRKTAPNFSEIS